MKRILFLFAVLSLIASCKKDDSEHKAKLYALDDIEGNYRIESIIWEGGTEIDQDNDGHCSRDLMNEFRYFSWPIGNYTQIKTQANKEKKEYGGVIYFSIPFLEIYVDGGQPKNEFHYLDFILPFRMQGIGNFVFDHFDHSEFRDEMDKNHYPARDSFRDGDVVSFENEKIQFRLKDYMVYDFSSSSYITGSVLMTFAMVHE